VFFLDACSVEYLESSVMVWGNLLESRTEEQTHETSEKVLERFHLFCLRWINCTEGDQAAVRIEPLTTSLLQKRPTFPPSRVGHIASESKNKKLNGGKQCQHFHSILCAVNHTWVHRIPWIWKDRLVWICEIGAQAKAENCVGEGNAEGSRENGSNPSIHYPEAPIAGFIEPHLGKPTSSRSQQA